MLENGAILDKSGSSCRNTYSTSGRNGRHNDIPCPGKLRRVQSLDPSIVHYDRFYTWEGCLCQANKSRQAFVAISQDSFFEGSHVPTHVLLLFILLWIAGVKHTSLCIITGCCNETATSWSRKLLSAVQWDVLNDFDGQMIGGPGVEVQVDESKVM